MAKLRLLKTGHGDLTLAEWDKDRPETIVTAEAAFAEHFTAGRLAFRLDGPGRSTPIHQFEKSAPEILIVPAIQGGCFRPPRPAVPSPAIKVTADENIPRAE